VAVHDTLKNEVEAYVLGALTPAETAAFERHLGQCPECASAVRVLEPAVAALAHAAPEAVPRPEVRRRILAAIATDEAVNSRRESLGRRSGPRGAWLAAAAALVVATGLGLYAVELRNRVAGLEVELHDAARRADAAAREIAAARLAANDAQSTVIVLAAPDLARVDLAGQPAAPSATARAFWSRSRGLIFTGSNLPPLPPGRVYQLWIVGPGAPTSAGLLTPDANGRVHAVFDTSRDSLRPIAFAVTIEPAGGVPAPTGDKYLVGLM